MSVARPGSGCRARDRLNIVGVEQRQTLVIIPAVIGLVMVFDYVMNLVTLLDGSSGEISGVWQPKASVQ